MNQGILGFPAQINTNQLDLKTYDTSGVYEIMPGTKGLYIYGIGGGGGGGGGARQAAATNAYGGGGGGGGVQILWYFRVEELGGVGSSLAVIIGSGGNGGTGGTSDTSNGSAGVGGGLTYVFVSGKRNIQSPNSTTAPLISLSAGSAGAAGTIASAAAGSGGRAFFWDNFNTQNLFSNGTASATNLSMYNMAMSAGGAGGGGHLLGVGTTGGSINISVATTIPQTISLDYAKNTTAFAGGSPNLTGPSDSSQQVFGTFSPGYGGAGGGGGTTTAATNGGNGYRGSGGGGGGGSLNGFAAGNGGKGGNGFVAIKAVY
jgi:hypothetical protein